MCGSVQPQRQQPVYTPPAACPPQAQPQAQPPAPKTCAPPPCDSFTPPPAPVVSPEKAPTVQSTPNADAPAACAKQDACAPERKGLMKMLSAIFTAVFAFAAVFMSRRAEPTNVDANRDARNNDREGCASRDWRNFEGRARQQRVIAPERDNVRPQVFTPPTCTQRV